MQSVTETTGSFMLGKELDILMAERARLARISYARTFFPEHLELRSPHDPDPAR